MKVVIYIAASLDGYIARENGNLDWLINIPNPKNEDYGFSDFMTKVDAVLMGRNTYETVLAFNEWPYTKKVFVLSNTLKTIKKGYEDKVTLVNGSIREIYENLDKLGISSLYVDGGKTIQSFLKEGLIDEMIITTVSKILGKGIPLFDNTGCEIEYEVYKTELLNKYLVRNSYRRRQ